MSDDKRMAFYRFNYRWLRAPWTVLGWIAPEFAARMGTRFMHWAGYPSTFSVGRDGRSFTLVVNGRRVWP